VRGEHLTRSLLRPERLDVSSVKHSLVGQCVFAACFGAAHFAGDGRSLSEAARRMIVEKRDNARAGTLRIES